MDDHQSNNRQPFVELVNFRALQLRDQKALVSALFLTENDFRVLMEQRRHSYAIQVSASNSQSYITPTGLRFDLMHLYGPYESVHDKSFFMAPGHLLPLHYQWRSYLPANHPAAFDTVAGTAHNNSVRSLPRIFDLKSGIEIPAGQSYINIEVDAIARIEKAAQFNKPDSLLRFR